MFLKGYTEIMQKNDKNYLDKLRHSASHLLAAAVFELYKEAKPTLGPPIEDGFYYDFDFGFKNSPSSDDLEKIEEKMREIVKGWDKFERIEVSNNKAIEQFNNNEYKKELIEEFSKAGEQITLYKSGNFVDLCRGGHVNNPQKELKHFKLLSVAGAYWRGNEKNPMLTRIYGTAFPSQKELDDYLTQIEEAKKRDHRKLGKEMDLFCFSEYVGSGMPLYTPKGTLIRKLLNDYVEEEQTKLGYTQVWTPQIAKAELFKLSGHYDKYKDDMFTVHSHYSDEEFFLKPMNCPQHTQIYASKPRSYKDLPLRYSDFAMLYRDEKPGELNGLARVRAFSTDDCHIFCREDQVDEEVDKALIMTKKVMETLGLKYRYRLSTRDTNNPEKYLGDPKTWDKVEKWAVLIMKRNKIEYFDAPGEAAFYAPKMDLMATDSLNREWQLSTVQIDYVQPARFKLEYTNNEGGKSLPIMIHRAILGSAERAMMILIEHFAGNFPTWLAPLQVKVLPISTRHGAYANALSDELKKNSIRIEVDDRNATLQGKIRDAQNEKVPYMLVIGDREEKDKKVAVRLRTEKDLGQMSLGDFVSRIKEKIDKKSLDL